MNPHCFKGGLNPQRVTLLSHVFEHFDLSWKAALSHFLLLDLAHSWLASLFFVHSLQMTVFLLVPGKTEHGGSGQELVFTLLLFCPAPTSASHTSQAWLKACHCQSRSQPSIATDLRQNSPRSDSHILGLPN